jgi:peptide/nickel transport system permease protein
LLRRFAPISTEHPLGTDENGRDVLSRLMYGGRVSLGVGFVAVLVAITSGLAFLSAERESSAARFSASAGAP